MKLFTSIRYPLVALCMWGLFHVAIENFLSSLIVDPFLSKITTEGDPPTVMATIALSLLGVYLFIQSCKLRKVIPYNILAWGYIGFVIYLCYRFGGTVWKFTPLSGNHPAGLRIMDLLLLSPIFILVANTFPIKRTHRLTDETKGFRSDSATQIDAQNDPDRRYQFVESITKKIIHTKNEEGSLCIAIVGKWGTGKTTFLKTIERELKKRDAGILQFTFNPWLVENEANVTKVFFKELSDALSAYHSSLQNDLSDYVDHLVADKDNWLYSGVGLLKKLLNIKSPTINDSKKRINETLIDLNKKIVIYIDDLDRLDGKETSDVIRIIRNSGDFANVFFVVALDKARVIHSLESGFGDASGSYLEKVFQIEFYLPPLRPLNLLQALNNQLTNYLSDDDKPVLTEMFTERSYEESFRWVEGQIKHYRDLKRYINQFVIQYSHLNQNIYFPDLYVLTFLRLKYPEVYYFIYLKKDHVLSNGLMGTEKIYRLDFDDDGRSRLNVLLTEKRHELKLSIENIEDIIEIMQHLFSGPLH